MCSKCFPDHFAKSKSITYCFSVRLCDSVSQYKSDTNCITVVVAKSDCDFKSASDFFVVTKCFFNGISVFNYISFLLWKLYT